MSAPINITNHIIQDTHAIACHYCGDNHAAEGLRRPFYDVYQNLGTIVVGGIRARTGIVRLRTDCRELAAHTLDTHKPGFIRKFNIAMDE